MKSIYGLAWRNLRDDRLHSILSVMAVMLGVSVTIAGSMIAESVREGILQSDELRTVMEGLIGMLDPMMLFVGLAVMLAGGFLIFNTFSMAITRRQEQIGALRLLGMQRGQLVRIILAEGLILAGAGVLLGIVVSLVMGQVLLAFIKQVIGQIFAFGDASPTIEVIILAAVMGLTITLLSVLIPARRAASLTPLTALHPPNAAIIENSQRWQPVVGVLLLFGLMLIEIFAPPGAWAIHPIDINLTLLFVLLWLIGVTLLLPSFIGLAARLSHRLLKGLAGRIITDNLQRVRGRVLLTVLTLAFALVILVGLTGFLKFFFIYGFGATMQTAAQRQAVFISRLDITNGWGSIMARGLDSVMLSEDELQALTDMVEGRASYTTIYLATVPELSFLGNSYFSYMVDPALLRTTGDSMFRFTEGDWATAVPIMEATCGVLVAPAVAARLDAGIGDTVSVTGSEGLLDCTIAGIGTSVAGATIISDTFRDQITALNPTMVFILPNFDTPLEVLAADINALQASYPELSVNYMSVFVEMLDTSTQMITVSLNAMLLLAMLAAAFGVVNTIVMGVDERQREISLLRAVGATKAQTRRIIIGEAVLMGVVGGVVGVLAGLGLIVIIVMTYGFNSFGIQLDLWQTALSAMQTALLTAVVGLIASPLIAGLAAWFPAQHSIRKNNFTTAQNTL